MCGLCLSEGGPRKRGRAADFGTPCTATASVTVANLVAADGSVHAAARHTLSSCTAIAAAAIASDHTSSKTFTVELPNTSAAALATALDFCQRVHNVGGREASVRIAWRKGFLPRLSEDGLLELVGAARALDATPLRQLACSGAAHALRARLVDGGTVVVDGGVSGLPAPCPWPAPWPAHAVSALGGVDALAEVLSSSNALDSAADGDGGTSCHSGEDALLRAADAVDDPGWREAVARVRGLGLGVDVAKLCAGVT